MNDANLSDNSGRRKNSNRRRFQYTLYIPERRSGVDRRKGSDRRDQMRYERDQVRYEND